MATSAFLQDGPPILHPIQELYREWTQQNLSTSWVFSVPAYVQCANTEQFAHSLRQLLFNLAHLA